MLLVFKIQCLKHFLLSIIFVKAILIVFFLTTKVVFYVFDFNNKLFLI